MKRILLTLTLVLFIAPIAKAQQTISSLENFINQNPDLTLFHSIADHHYFVKDEPMTWTDSKNHGDKIGVSMYVINDQAEENEVFSNLPINTGYWLGLYQDIDDPNFSEPNGGWKWVDGSELSYTNWFTNEPNDVNGEDYVEFNDGQGIRWNDVPNDNAGNLNIPIYEFVSFGDILLNGTVSAENNQIKNVADPTEAQDAVTKSYFDANKLLSPNKNIAQILLVGNDAYGKQLKGLAYPTDVQDAVTLSVLLNKIETLQDQIDALQASSDSGTVTDQDGNSYPYLTYGDQVWTVKNAEVVTYWDGTPIPQVTDAKEWANLTTGAWCYYDNDPSKGKLYNWYAVAGIHDNDENTPNKELAPEGWHVPTNDEWTTLENYLIAYGYNYDQSTTENKIAKAMASKSGWTTWTGEGAIGNDLSLNNSSGFNAVPGGSILGDVFSGYGSEARFWTSTYFGSNNLYHKRMDYRFSHIYLHNEGATLASSIRFVKDYQEASIDNDGDGYTEHEGDCDDSDAAIYPGAPEICDGIDNDCDGEVDEGVTNPYYEDADGDGYGLSTVGPVMTCSPPAGYVSNNLDCDDSDAAIYPGALEICDGIDNDCDSEIDEGSVCNTPPVISTASINPPNPTTNDDLNCFVSATDDNGDAITFSFTWFINGVILENNIGQTLPASNTLTGDAVYCQVTASDGQAESVFMTASVEIKNDVAPGFAISDNGKTIICDDLPAGTEGIVNGKTYVVVDREMIEDRIKQQLNLDCLCTTNIDDMSYLLSRDNYDVFYSYAGSLDLSSWDTSNVTNMQGIFLSNWSAIGQGLGYWDVSNVTDMSSAFRNIQTARSFLSNTIENWDVSSVTNMSRMFDDIRFFNLDLGGWDVSEVTDMSYMFYGADQFNQDLSAWQVSNVYNCYYFYSGNYTKPKPDFTNCNLN